MISRVVPACGDTIAADLFASRFTMLDFPTFTGPATATSGGPVVAALAGVGVHSLAMILTTAVIAAIVHCWLGVGVLRNAWLNVDLLWTFALVATGALLLFV